jgi:hypothetical protein
MQDLIFSRLNLFNYATEHTVRAEAVVSICFCYCNRYLETPVVAV